MACCWMNVCRDKKLLYYHKQIKGVLFIKIAIIACQSVDIVATRWVVTFCGIRAGRTFRLVSCESAMFFCAFSGYFVDCLMLVVFLCLMFIVCYQHLLTSCVPTSNRDLIVVVIQDFFSDVCYTMSFNAGSRVIKMAICIICEGQWDDMASDQKIQMMEIEC